MNKMEEVLNAIHDNRLEIPILQALQTWVITDRMLTHNKLMFAKAHLRAIKKINQGTDKSIEALCEEEGEDK